MELRRSRSVGAVLVTLVALVLVIRPASGVSSKPPADKPRNVILFIVDGMGPGEIELGRRMNGGSLFIDSIPWEVKGTLETSSLDGVTDSAAGATALASGVETHNGWLGMVPTAGGAMPVETALERAQDRGKATALISDSYITDATPAGFAAHVTSRSQLQTIATQMAGQGIEFLMGGGLRQGSVAPLQDLPGVSYVSSAAELDAYVTGGGAGPVYGFFDSWNMVYNLDRDDESVAGADPTLPRMTSAALSVLSKDPDGFFLMVEGGLVDWGGHARDGALVGTEMIEADDAVRAAWRFARDRTDTLILFTADHETGALRLSSETDIAGLSGQTASTEYMWGLIGKGAPIAQTVATYTGITNLTSGERATIRACGETGISDVLGARWKISWGRWSCTDEGEHTLTPVPVYAFGPKAADFAGTIPYDNERVGQLLLSYFA